MFDEENRNLFIYLGDEMPYDKRQEILEQHIQDLQNLQVCFIRNFYYEIRVFS